MIHLPSNRRIVADLLRAVGTYHRRARMITSHRLLQSHLRLVRLAQWGLVCLALLVVIECCRELRRLSDEYNRSQPRQLVEPGMLAGEKFGKVVYRPKLFGTE